MITRHSLRVLIELRQMVLIFIIIDNFDLLLLGLELALRLAGQWVE